MDMEKFLEQIVSKMLFHYSQNNPAGAYYYLQVAFSTIAEKMLPEPLYHPTTKPWSQSEIQNIDEMIRFINDVSNAFKYLSSGIESMEDYHSRFLLGKKATQNITMDNGIIIVEAGEVITEKILNNAKLADKYAELAMNAQ